MSKEEEILKPIMFKSGREMELQLRDGQSSTKMRKSTTLLRNAQESNVLDTEASKIIPRQESYA